MYITSRFRCTFVWPVDILNNSTKTVVLYNFKSVKFKAISHFLVAFPYYSKPGLSSLTAFYNTDMNIRQLHKRLSQIGIRGRLFRYVNLSEILRFSKIFIQN